MTAVELSGLQRAMLELEGRLWLRPGPKEAAIREQFGISPTRYYQTLHALIDTPAALAAAPQLVHRLRRLREQRRRARSTHRRAS